MGRAAGIDRRHGSRRRRHVRGPWEGRYLTRAVDTNVIVRALVNDDPRQAELANSVLSKNFTVAISVFLETEWVLRSQYRWSRTEIAENLLEIVDLASFSDMPKGIGWALARYAAGADFADVIHLISPGTARSFVTFDKRLAAKAGPDTPLPVETLA
jgi:predicted nucleic-acid-binding protein